MGVKMTAQEFNYILEYSNLSFDALAVLTGYSPGIVEDYSHGIISIPSCLVRLLRLLHQRPEFDYPSRLLRARCPVPVPTDASLLSIDGNGEKTEWRLPAGIEIEDAVLQRELCYLFAQPPRSSKLIAEAFGVTLGSVQRWFATTSSGPSEFMRRLLRVAVDTDLFVQMLSAPEVEVSAACCVVPSEPKMATEADATMSQAEFFYILAQLGLTVSELRVLTGYTNISAMASGKHLNIPMAQPMKRLLRLTAVEPDYLFKLAAMTKPLYPTSPIDQHPSTGVDGSARAELQHICAALGGNAEIATLLGLSQMRVAGWIFCNNGRPNKFTLRLLRLATQTDILRRLSEPQFRCAVEVHEDFVVPSRRPGELFRKNASANELVYDLFMDVSAEPPQPP